MNHKWTPKGLTVEVTNTINGMLEQGGVCGRVEHYSTEDLAALEYAQGYDLTPTDLLRIRELLQPRVLRQGQIIR